VDRSAPFAFVNELTPIWKTRAQSGLSGENNDRYDERENGNKQRETSQSQNNLPCLSAGRALGDYRPDYTQDGKHRASEGPKIA
jgi:hypothetical protein